MITTRAREGGPKEHRVKQICPRETHSVTYVPGLFTLFDLSRIDAQPPPSFLCCPRPPSHHPSSPTSVSLVPALTYFRQQHPSGHTVLIPFFPHSQTISTLFDLLCSLTPFLFQLSYAPLPNSIHSWCERYLNALDSYLTVQAAPSTMNTWDLFNL